LKTLSTFEEGKVRVILSSGRVMMEVHHAERAMAGPYKGQTVYCYRGDYGGGFNQNAAHLQRLVTYIKADYPSARVVGALPAPVNELQVS
jgi:hypothetical protein